jgi:hypothetical protein
LGFGLGGFGFGFGSGRGSGGLSSSSGGGMVDCLASPRLASTRRDRERRGVCVVAVLNLVLCVQLACECEISSVVMMWWKGDLAVLLASVIFFFVSHEFL